jgi:putative ABC transport system permease protein
MAILRSVGARPAHVFALLIAESMALTISGIAVGLGIFYAALVIAQPMVSASYGLYLAIAPPTARELLFLALVVVAGALSGAVPAWRAYARSLADGMTART